MSNIKAFKSHNPFKFAPAQYECPIYGDESGIILVVDNVAYVTDCYDVMNVEEKQSYREYALNGDLPLWAGKSA